MATRLEDAGERVRSALQSTSSSDLLHALSALERLVPHAVNPDERSSQHSLEDLLVRSVLLSPHLPPASRSSASCALASLFLNGTSLSTAARASELIAHAHPSSSSSSGALCGLTHLLHSLPSHLANDAPTILQCACRCFTKCNHRSARGTRSEALRCLAASLACASVASRLTPQLLSNALHCLQSASSSSKPLMMRRDAAAALQQYLPALQLSTASSEKLLNSATSLAHKLLSDSDASVAEIAAHALASRCRVLCSSLSSDSLPVHKQFRSHEAALFAARSCFASVAESLSPAARTSLCVGWAAFIRSTFHDGELQDDELISLTEQERSLVMHQSTLRLAFTNVLFRCFSKRRPLDCLPGRAVPTKLIGCISATASSM